MEPFWENDGKTGIGKEVNGEQTMRAGLQDIVTPLTITAVETKDSPPPIPLHTQTAHA